MQHLEEHPHAFLDANSVVINVAIFSEHDSELLQTIANAIEATSFICCCDNGLAQVGWRWLDTHWQPTKPDNIKNYEWSEEKLEWVQIP